MKTGRFARWDRMQWYCLALAGLLMAPGVGICQGRLDVAFDLLRASVTAHEPVYIRFSVHNGLGERVLFDLGSDRTRNFELLIVGPDGLMTNAPPIEGGGVHRAGKAYAPPDGSYVQLILINERYQFTRAAVYKLKIRFNALMVTDSGKSIDPPPQELTLSVAPRDPKRLGEACETLLKSAEGTSNYEKLREAAVALSYVIDPVAVPYLGRLLAKHNSVSEVAVQGLARIGSPEALQVLSSNLDTPDGELRMKIQGAIEEIRTGVHPEIMD